MSNSKLKDICEKVKDISIEAGISIMEIYNKNKINYSFKKDTSPLTEADIAANNIICTGLKKLELSAHIVSEESEAIPFYYRKNKMIWLIDPLDGTKEFLNKSGDFTVNIALIMNNKPILGVVYVPFTQDLYWAYINGGSWKRDKKGVITKLHVSEYKYYNPGIRILVSKSHCNPETSKFINDFVYPQITSVGSSLKLLMIATGDADIYPRLAPTMEWDIAAAHIIVNEAGGSVKDIHNLELSYNKEDLHNPHFITRGKEIDL